MGNIYLYVENEINCKDAYITELLMMKNSLTHAACACWMAAVASCRRGILQKNEITNGKEKNSWDMIGVR